MISQDTKTLFQNFIEQCGQSAQRTFLADSYCVSTHPRVSCNITKCSSSGLKLINIQFGTISQCLLPLDIVCDKFKVRWTNWTLKWSFKLVTMVRQTNLQKVNVTSHLFKAGWQSNTCCLKKHLSVFWWNVIFAVRILWQHISVAIDLQDWHKFPQNKRLFRYGTPRMTQHPSLPRWFEFSVTPIIKKDVKEQTFQ